MSGEGFAFFRWHCLIYEENCDEAHHDACLAWWNIGQDVAKKWGMLEAKMRPQTDFERRAHGADLRGLAR
jgi:hypothetical protein